MQTEFQGHTITVTEELEFRVDGPLYNGENRYGKTFESASQAREAIQKRVKAQEAQDRVKLSIPVVDEQGRPVTITGVHARNFNALGIGDATTVFPPAQWIIDMIKERDAARAKVKTLSDELGKYRIDPKPYGMRSHEQAVEKIVKDAERQTQAAANRELPGRAA